MPGKLLPVGRVAAAARNAYRIYTLLPENHVHELTAVGFRQVAFYPDDQLVELESEN